MISARLAMPDSAGRLLQLRAGERERQGRIYLTTWLLRGQSSLHGESWQDVSTVVSIRVSSGWRPKKAGPCRITLQEVRKTVCLADSGAVQYNDSSQNSGSSRVAVHVVDGRYGDVSLPALR